MEEKIMITPQKYEECMMAKIRCQMIENIVQKALNEDDGYINTKQLAVILGIEKEKKNEAN